LACNSLFFVVSLSGFGVSIIPALPSLTSVMNYFSFS
jgi:hypothetical protein